LNIVPFLKNKLQTQDLSLIVIKPTKKALIFIWFVVLLAIFDKPFLDFLFTNDLSLPVALSQHNYPAKEFLIVILWIISIILFPVVFFVGKDGKWTFRHNVLYRELFIIAVTTYYLFIRNSNFAIGETNYLLSGFGPSGEIRYLDILLLLPVLSLFNLLLCITSGVKEKKIEHNSFWDYDKPIDSESDNHVDSYRNLSSLISGQINSVSDRSSSFSIGIVGPWGSGKTSFLNSLKADIQNNKPNQVIDFNPWLYPDETNLTKAFLNELSLRLSPYSILGSTVFNNLINKLFKDKSNIWGIIANGISGSYTMETIYQSLRDSILRSKKRVIVMIDDIDRLEFKEIYEILTIIRNVGNLPNTVFVLAYDKDYLLEVLTGNIKRPQQYLSKFFQAEYPLGKISTELMVNVLSKQIDQAFPYLFSGSQKFIASNKITDMLNAYTTLNSMAGIKLIKNHRDIKRLMNNIRILWPLFRGDNPELDIFFIEFLQLEILRLKYGNVYTKIKYLDESLFIKRNDSIIFDPTKINNIAGLFENYNDQMEVDEILKSLFPLKDQAPAQFSVRNINYFEYYFLSDEFALELTTTTTTTFGDDEIS
jgi:GTPase SAR1 family protein